MNEWELGNDELEDVAPGCCLLKLYDVEKAAQKKLVEWLEQETMLWHGTDSYGAHDVGNCDVCKLLKELGLE